eukprot:12399809-Karenia_brevis.AAC.1
MPQAGQGAPLSGPPVTRFIAGVKIKKIWLAFWATSNPPIPYYSGVRLTMNFQPYEQHPRLVRWLPRSRGLKDGLHMSCPGKLIRLAHSLPGEIDLMANHRFDA